MSEESNKKEIVGKETEESLVDTPAEVVNMIHCPRCGQYKPAHHIDQHLCVDCAKAENNRITYYRQHQADWINNAKENGLDL